MRVSASAVLLLTLMAATGASAQVNMGDQKAEATLPFTITKVASFDTQVWRMAFLPDGRFLAAEKGGRVWLMTQQGAKTAVAQAIHRRSLHRSSTRASRPSAARCIGSRAIRAGVRPVR